MVFPAEDRSSLQGKCIFLQRKMRFPAEKCSFGGAHCRKPQEIAGGFQGSRIKNASQLSQDVAPRTVIRKKGFPDNLVRLFLRILLF